MAHSMALVIRGANGTTETWSPTTLDTLGKDEAFLEETIASTPELLRLGNRSTGIHGPYVPFCQLEFSTPLGRGIRPDIVFLTASGHVIIVEVKLSNNPELSDRKVVAQIVDYAASLTSLEEEQVKRLFGAKDGSQQAWVQRIGNLFPSDKNPDELGSVLLSRLATGDLCVCIACDKAPSGLQEMLRGISSQKTLDFSLDLVEIEPHVCEGQPDILFVPRTRLITEVVGRTVVTVTYSEGSPKPGVKVETTSVEEMEENIKKAQPSRRNLTWEELEAHAEEHQVGPLYQKVLSKLRPLFDGATRTQSNLALNGMLDGSRCALIGVYPDASSSARGLALMFYPDQVATFFGLSESDIMQFLGPASGDADTWWPEQTWFFTDSRLDELVKFLSKGKQK